MKSNNMKKILVTGGAGYIGSHTVLGLIRHGYGVVVIDNLFNSSKESINRVEKLASKSVEFIEGDILDEKLLSDVFSQHKFEAVINFSGLKAVGESMLKPIEYYQNNVEGTLTLIEVMRMFSVNIFVFSSSATVYGERNTPYSESQAIGKPSSPYGKTKAMVEQILKVIAK
jgi:UDP-glucose 4-epimerase